MKIIKITILMIIVASIAVALTVLLVLPRTDVNSKPTPQSLQAEADYAHLVIPPLPRSVDLDPNRVHLGKKLFHDNRLSANGTISCASCHDIRNGGDDGRPVSIGINNQLGSMNSPTVLNSAFNFKHFWDGRAETLEDQVGEPMKNQKEMGMSWESVLSLLMADDQYRKLFATAYSNGINRENIENAIATFERSLITPNSPFDKFLRGEQELPPEAAKGWHLFQDLGCISCHQGINIGGNVFQTLGRMESYFKGREITKADLGRYNVTGNPRDKHKFKVPSLRNIALTAPYFHDGSVKTLNEAVRVMARVQLGFDLADHEIISLVAFLETLTGELP